MNNLRKKLPVAAVLLAAGCAVTSFIIACSDDTSVSDGTGDGGKDASNDNNTVTEGGTAQPPQLAELP